MVSSSQNTVPLFSQVLPRPGASHQGAGRASTPILSQTPFRQPFRPLEDGPASTELSESGASAVRDFLIAHGNDYETIRKISPDQTRAMEIAWIATGVHTSRQREHPHPSFIENLSSSSWKTLRVSLKSLMFDSVSPLGFHCVFGPVTMLTSVGLCSE